MMSKIKRIIRILLTKKKKEDLPLKEYIGLENSSTIEIYAALRHEVHRIEKAAYNNLLSSKKDIFNEKVQNARDIQKLIRKKDPNFINNPVYDWSDKILNSYPDIFTKYTKKYSYPTKELSLNTSLNFIEQVKNRRSSRVWNHSGIKEEELLSLIDKFIDVAIWAPNSGNRQSIRLRPIYKQEEKELLIGIKEKHCYTAPLLFYIGVDTRLYGALSSFEECMFLDAGAAIMQMILFADSMGLGSCWNHFGLDMINSRPSNIPIYENFKTKLEIPDYIIPIAILSVGYPLYNTPSPERMPKEYFLI